MWYLMSTFAKMLGEFACQSVGKDAQRFPDQTSVSNDQNAGLVAVGQVLTGSVKKCLQKIGTKWRHSSENLVSANF